VRRKMSWHLAEPNSNKAGFEKVNANPRFTVRARRDHELRATAEISDLHEETLTSILEMGDLPDVFHHISNVTQKILAHDALVVAKRSNVGNQDKVYASWTSSDVSFPEVVDVPQRLIGDSDWEFDLIDDLREASDQEDFWTTRNGYRSTLRLPIRLENESVGGLSFLSFTPGQYTSADVPVAKRIADCVALNFARDRGSALMRRAGEAAERAAR
jgi:hypothetical protein